MLKYVDAKVVFAEVPDEVTLAINISNCPCSCKGCHSPYLGTNTGEPLFPEVLDELIDNNKGITCVAIMGGDSNPAEVDALAFYIKAIYDNIKVAWYSGRQELSGSIKLKNFDYIKLGPYKEECGPLNSKTTNQRFYRVKEGNLVDITEKFWK
jgi:anaerobic ribonucleoside-triphosphate reductase activating protein